MACFIVLFKEWQSEVEETLKRLGQHKGVQGVLIMNQDGIPIRSTLQAGEHATAVQHSALLTQLCSKAKNVVRELDPSNDLTFLRIRTKKHEILVAPDKDYLLAVVQTPQQTANSASVS